MDTSGNQVSPRRRRIGAIAAVFVLITLGVIVWQTWEYWAPGERMAVDPGPGDRGGPPPPPPGGFRGPPSAEGMRRRFQDQIKTSLAASDEEWAKLRPGIEKVTQFQDQLRPQMGMGPGMGAGPGTGRGPGPRPADATVASEFAEKSELLRASVDDEQTSDAALAANVAAAREARKKLQAELKAAQEDLRRQLTPKQEATLALLGVLD